MAKVDKKKKRSVIRGIILVALVAAIIFAIAPKNDKKALAVGDLAPDFELVDVEGNTHRLSDYRGQGVFLNFWGTWCPPCKAEMPYMDNQYKEFKDKGVQILTVNLGESQFKIENFRDQLNLTFPMLMDKNKNVTRGTYMIGPLPTTLLIDKDGKITSITSKGLTEQEIKTMMESIKPE